MVQGGTASGRMRHKHSAGPGIGHQTRRPRAKDTMLTVGEQTQEKTSLAHLIPRLAYTKRRRAAQAAATPPAHPAVRFRWAMSLVEPGKDGGMSAMATQHGASRAPRWGADLPTDEAQARDRLLHAAETCFSRYGVNRTKMAHIAQEAGVHRTTVYSYFPSRDAILAACFVRAAGEVVAAANPFFESDEPFSERLVKAMLIGLTTARSSPAMNVLTGQDELAQTRRAAEASEIWRTDIQSGLAKRFAAAAADGEIRSDVPPNALAHWVTRVCFSLIAEPGKPEYGGDEGLIRTLIPAALAPPPR